MSSLQIVVQYPAGYRFNSIDLNLVDGSVASSQQLNVGGLDINVGQSGSVNIKNIVIGSNININVPVSVTLAQIAISQDTTLDVQSNGDIFMSFLQVIPDFNNNHVILTIKYRASNSMVRTL